MRNRVLVCLVFLLIAGCSQGSPTHSGVSASRLSGLPPYEEIASAYVSGQPFVPDKPIKGKTLRQIMEWLAVAEVTDGEISPSMRGGERMLFLVTTGGQRVSFRLADDCETAHLDDGRTSVSCRRAEDQLIFDASPLKGVRIRAPELAAWLTK